MISFFPIIYLVDLSENYLEIFYDSLYITNITWILCNYQLSFICVKRSRDNGCVFRSRRPVWFRCTNNIIEWLIPTNSNKYKLIFTNINLKNIFNQCPYTDCKYSFKIITQITWKFYDRVRDNNNKQKRQILLSIITLSQSL